MEIRFEADWFAVDREGRVGFFAGGTGGAIPTDADLDGTADAIDELARAPKTRVVPSGYRGARTQPIEPIFDQPASSEGGVLHERPIAGYPHLVSGHNDELLQTALPYHRLREAHASVVASVVVDELSDATWASLHDDAPQRCLGCRATVHPDDAPPRAPELVASAGLYVFAHTSGHEGYPYVRVASPSIPAHIDDLAPFVAALARRVELPTRSFARHTRILPSKWVRCR